jgi:heat shock protein 1/8
LIIILTSFQEFEAEQKNLEQIANPIMTKLYSGEGGMPSGMPGAPGAGGNTNPDEGPTVEEVD